MPTLEARGVELSWRQSGSGAAVLLLHETGTTADAWEPVAGTLGEPVRAILYDRRGWGASSAPDDYRRTTIEEQSEDAASLIEALAAAPAVLCGAGIGAVIALDLLLRRPELLAGAVLVEPILLQLIPEANEALADDRRALERIAAEGREAVVDLYLSGGLAALGAGAGRLPAALGAPARERPTSLLAELGAATTWSLPPGRLRAATRRSVIVTSAATPPLLVDAAGALASRLRSSEERRVDSPETPPHLGAPEAVAAIVVELARAGPTPS
jgi:pimeloyl-ACP methyl ester carboxylesterase